MQILLFLFATIFSSVHELHLSMCTFSYNEEGQRIEVQQRIFYDDLESSLQFQLKNDRFNILKPEESILNYDSLLIDYANAHLDIYINDNDVELTLLEYEIKDDAIILYMYKVNVAKLNSIEIFSHILFEIFDDQDNVISIEAHGTKKSKKFDMTSKPLELVY